MAAHRPRGAPSGARRARPREAQPADDDDGGHGAEGGPGLPQDLRAVPRRPGRLPGCLRARVVQAVPPRHGAEGALSRQGGAFGGADLAGSGPGRGSSADRRGRRRGAEGQAARQAVGARPDLHGLVLGGELPSVGQARRRQWRAPASRPDERLGGERARPSGRAPGGLRGGEGGVRRRERPEEGEPRRPDRAWWLGGCRGGGEGGRP